MHILKASTALILAAGLAACSEDKAAEIKEKPTPTVLVQKVAFASAVRERSYSATIRPRIVSDHAFRVTGKVVKRLVDVGDRVRAGQKLAELDSADLKLQLTQAEAEVTAAGNALKQQTIESGRIEKLARKGWAASSTLDKQRVAMDEAQARLDKAKQAADLARNSIAYTALAAYTDGVVTETSIEPGQVAEQGQKAISIARDGEMEALVSIPEADAALLAKSEASLSIWSDASKRYPVKLRELSPLADAASRTFAARFAIMNADADLRLGMSAELHLKSDGARAATIPLSAVLDQGKGPGVWSVDAKTGAITLKPVTVTAIGSATASISDGVADGETIVAMGAQKLDAGLKVRPVESIER
jgi:RND family efflux transporter MFP subunit